MSSTTSCPICASSTVPIGVVTGTLGNRRFDLRRCPSCSFAFVANPWTDYETIYSADYYAGKGADPLVNYGDELLNASSIRNYEWRGILKWVRAVAAVPDSVSWLDYGCGPGGLVRFLRSEGLSNAYGFEPSPNVPTWPEDEAPILSPEELAERGKGFSIITAIEVIEHVVDPVAELSAIRSLLRPGGFLFLTTGNAAPYRDRLPSWGYVRPEIHVSYFEPVTLGAALERAGFTPLFPGYADGWTEILRFKVLKNLRVKSSSALERLLPWSVIGHLVDKRLGATAHPVGFVPVEDADD